MKILDCESYKVVLIEKGDTPDLFEVPEQYNEEELIYVPLVGVQSNALDASRFLVKNPESSFKNHMMWEGLLDDSEQTDYIFRCARRFHETGEQMLIEDYEFQSDEPFYDYSK